MNHDRQGWTLLIFLIVISLLVLLSTNGFKIASSMAVTARMRYRNHQESRLLEGLLTYGIAVCNDNKLLLLKWGAEKSQTMYLQFNQWPSQSTIAAIGRYSGAITITSQKGSLYVGANLSNNENAVMTGQCMLKPIDTRNPSRGLVVSGWNIKAGG